MQKYPHITESYACILENVCYYVFIINKFVHFFGDMLCSKKIEICDSFVIYV